MTQKEMILTLLKEGKKLTQLDALKETGTMRLSSRINDLKNDGYKIKKTMKHSINRFGKKISYAEYSLGE